MIKFGRITHMGRGVFLGGQPRSISSAPHILWFSPNYAYTYWRRTPNSAWFFSGRGAIFRGLDTPLGIAQMHSAVCQRWVSYAYANSSLVASTTSSSTSTSTVVPSTSTSTKYDCTKLHNLEHFTKILGFTEMHRVKVKHTQQLGG